MLLSGKRACVESRLVARLHLETSEKTDENHNSNQDEASCIEIELNLYWNT